MASTRVRILFLCTGNSARSILAEAIANEMFGDQLTASSAGSKPKGAPNPMALKTLESHGLRTDRWASKLWTEFKDESFDLVVTLCDSAAREECPIFPGVPIQTHWGFPDPPAASDPGTMFEKVYQGLVEAIEAFVGDEETEIDVRAAKVSRLVTRWFPEAAIM